MVPREMLKPGEILLYRDGLGDDQRVQILAFVGFHLKSECAECCGSGADFPAPGPEDEMIKVKNLTDGTERAVKAGQLHPLHADASQ